MSARRRRSALRLASALVLAGMSGASLLATTGGAAPAAPMQTTTFSASFTPDRLAAPVNLAASLGFAASEGVPEPVSEIVAYGPAGLGIDVTGLAPCERARLELDGPGGCPAESRVGFGGGVGVVELAGAPVKETYTLDVFLAPPEHGRLALLFYVNAANPFSVRLVLTGREVHGPGPYGFGIAVEVPPIYTLPGQANASAESGYVTLGGADVAYFRKVHGTRRLVHVKGLTTPSSCPRGGFPFTALVTFEDGSTSSPSYAAPCPRGRR